jgi:hypothetical protein
MTYEEFKTVAENHGKWLFDRHTGKQAMLENIDLSHADLPDATLKKACLRGANLSHANLPGINLSHAILTDVNFSYAYLGGANLQYALLQGADLSYTNLRHANLLGAVMEDVDITEATLPDFQIPQHGELRVYKKVQRKIVHLLIPAWAKRTACLINRKCRASAAIVLAIEGDKPVRSKSWTCSRTTYEIGKTVYPDSYDPDPRVDCTHGIHFFLTREEAKRW